MVIIELGYPKTQGLLVNFHKIKTYLLDYLAFKNQLPLP